MAAGGGVRVATAQLAISADVRVNGARIRALMRDAAAADARLVQFPEGALSGYAVHQVEDWADVDWATVREEIARIADLAADLGVWVALGSAHRLTPPHRPHNSLYVVSDTGEVVARYDKRMCSATETTHFYAPGTTPVVFDVDGFRFGCLICIEVNFPGLFLEYDRLGVDCVLLSAYPLAADALFRTKALAHAAIHNVWLGLSTPTESAELTPSTFIAPDGRAVSTVVGAERIAFGDLDREDPALEVALHRARPWRASAASGAFHRDHIVSDARSSDRTSI